MPTTLKLLPREQYRGVNELDPIRYYYWPIFGSMYRRRVELALNECRGGERILEVGFGTGLTFLNLHEMYDEIHGIDLTADIGAVQSVFKPLDIPLYLRQGSVLELPYAENTFDTVLLISILEHLKPQELPQAMGEIHRVLKPGGQMVYGVPVERRLMVLLFRLLGHDIRKEHFSTEKQVAKVASQFLREVRRIPMKSTPPWFGAVYEVGHFVKEDGQ
ncbi:MAG: class I SAM-dependent methyltransferase [Anaerolineae bacterium]